MVLVNGHTRTCRTNGPRVFLVLTFLSLVAWAFILPLSAGAEDYVEDDFPYADARQARVSLIQGDVMIHRGDDDDWAYTTVNVPLRPHDKIWATEDARCEIQIHGGSTVRIAEQTNMDILALEQDLVQVDLTAGVATFHIREDGSGGVFEVATPLAAIEAYRARFRVDVHEDGTTDVTVWSGNVDLETVAGPVRVGPGQQATIVDDGEARFLLAAAPQEDSWDRWNRRRDRQMNRPKSRRYVETDDPWVADLDLYGSWYSDTSYGWVWVPSVRVSWTPYRDGRWVWVEPWGWTWVSYEPWGWGPYHYGRWVHLRHRGWAWVPGRGNVWIPGNARFIYGTSWVAWVPLGYRDHYYYNRRPKIGVSLSLSNYGVSGAVTIVSNVGFLNGTYGSHRVRLRHDPLRAGGRIAGSVPLEPIRASLRAVSRHVRAKHRPPSYVQRKVVHIRDTAPIPRKFNVRHKAVTHEKSTIRKVRKRTGSVTRHRTVSRRKGEGGTKLKSTVIKKSVVKARDRTAYREGAEGKGKKKGYISSSAGRGSGRRAQPVQRYGESIERFRNALENIPQGSRGKIRRR